MWQVVWVGIFSIVLAWSAYQPHDYFTWFLEVFPALLGVGVLVITCKSFPLTPLLYTLILIHCLILMVGGHYTYAEVPLFNDFKEWFGFERNNYDKVGHFVQGFVPAMIARELMLRKQIVNGRGWMNFFISPSSRLKPPSLDGQIYLRY
ncbi:MAG: DUF2238 domain-containing protein [Thiofilum sp.]|uniref:DUF2238 domain-containing protein n=1 Tax=Thiofilum sp. TaxID=2212733 RepID=UPI0025D4FC53|nr:DUF2238 domain-containing protein [Thiofilum sp.]MBK8452978.1 DUF2238 domain-containing protein [Thiofilum sp.]